MKVRLNMLENYLPKITIIVAVFNGATTLLRCMKSIYSQTYINKELIIIDGGSTDESVGIIQKNSHHISYWESESDRGIYHAWNKALSHAKGEWICFLGADDYFLQDDVLEKLLPNLGVAKARDIRLVYGRVASIDKMGKVKNLLGTCWEKAKSLQSHHLPPHPGLLHHTNIFKEHGRFDESFKIVADGELLFKELKIRDAMFVPDIITVGAQHGGLSCKMKNLPRLIKEDMSARGKNGLKVITFQTLKYYILLLKNSLFY